MIGAADHRAAGNVLESFLLGDALEFVESLGRNVLCDWKMTFGWLQILAHRENIAVRRSEVIHRCQDFSFRLSESQHDP